MTVSQPHTCCIVSPTVVVLEYIVQEEATAKNLTLYRCGVNEQNVYGKPLL